MAFKKVKVADAIGMVLGHDITKIIPGEYKGPAFKKGHIIRAEDIEHLRNIGKEHIYSLEISPSQLHEHDAVVRMSAAIGGKGVYCAEPSEGKVNIKAAARGLLKINRDAVNEINMLENAIVSTLHSNRIVDKNDLLAGVKVIPLVVDEELVIKFEAICAKYASIISIEPFLDLKIGIIITGSEVYYGRIKDKFADVFDKKISNLGAKSARKCYVPDDENEIRKNILNYKNEGMDIIIVSGGMSVDPDDVTPESIRSTGASVVTYGTPVLPGGMFMLAYLDNVPVLGVPACGMYSKITVFDLVFARLMVGERLNRNDITELGYGGLCEGCATCTFPHCSFGKK